MSVFSSLKFVKVRLKLLRKRNEENTRTTEKARMDSEIWLHEARPNQGGELYVKNNGPQKQRVSPGVNLVPHPSSPARTFLPA